ncbi:cytochrome P450 [Lactarius deliciosus]|nr:cytochrome P450 [Lactarius deliciosus]
MFDLFDNVWGDSPEIVLDHCIALFVVGAAGFGRRVTWTSDLSVPPDHQMTFKDALRIVSSNLILKMGVPKWAMKLTERTRRVNLAFDELRQYMVEMVHARRSAETKEERYDLFSGLLDASHDNPDGGVAITEQELIGNMFIFLFAGHETTAHALCFTFALLALYPDEQERLYQQIKEILVDTNGTPSYEDMNQVHASPCVLNESLRMLCPSVPKHAAEDTSLTGTRIKIHVPGLHYNPKYWKDPHTFRPDRFLGEWPRNAFLPFSSGARGCLGRRFFETEGIAAITVMILRKSPEFLGETFEQRYARITAFDQMFSSSPRRVPLVFKKR